MSEEGRLTRDGRLLELVGKAQYFARRSSQTTMTPAQRRRSTENLTRVMAVGGSFLARIFFTRDRVKEMLNQ